MQDSGAHCSNTCYQRREKPLSLSNYPNPGGAGGSETAFGALKIKQSWDERANAINVNGYAFTLSREGSKLAFADHTYLVTTGPKTIVIAKDGATHEGANQ